MIKDRLAELKRGTGGITGVYELKCKTKCLEQSPQIRCASSAAKWYINLEDYDMGDGESHEEATISIDIEAEKDENTEEEVKEEEVISIPSLRPEIEAVLNVYSQILLDFNLIQTNSDLLKHMIVAEDFKETDFFKIRQNSIHTGNKVLRKFQTLEKELPPEDEFTTLARMKRLLYYGLFQKYVHIWTEIQIFLLNLGNLKRTLGEQSSILNIDLDDEENGDNLVCNISEDTKHARKTLNAVTARSEDLKKLEASCEELYALFAHLQILVMQQSVAMQCIEKHVQDAQNYVKLGNENLAIAANL